MKNILLLLISSLLILSVSGCGNEETEETEEVSVQLEELTREDEIAKVINERVESEYRRTSINNIRVNEVVSDGTYIVLVDLSFDAKNSAKQSKSMIEMYSSDLAATLANEEDIKEIVSFWQVPYLKEGDNVAKIATERSGEGMAFTEQWYDHNIFD